MYSSALLSSHPSSVRNLEAADAASSGLGGVAMVTGLGAKMMVLSVDASDGVSGSNRDFPVLLIPRVLKDTHLRSSGEDFGSVMIKV